MALQQKSLVSGWRVLVQLPQWHGKHNHPIHALSCRPTPPVSMHPQPPFSYSQSRLHPDSAHERLLRADVRPSLSLLVPLLGSRDLWAVGQVSGSRIPRLDELDNFRFQATCQEGLGRPARLQSPVHPVLSVRGRCARAQYPGED